MAVFKVAAIGEDGKYFDDFALTDVINYVVNPRKTPSNLIGAFGVRLEYAAQQMELVARAFNKYQKLRLRHWIISFGDRDLINPVEAYYIAVEAAKFYADRYQLIFAVHEDTDQVHVHFVMNQVSYVDGHKYSGTKKEYYDFIYYMKDVCAEYDVSFIPVTRDSEEYYA